MRRDNIEKLAKNPDKIYYGKRFDYKAVKKDGYYIAYRRQLENDPWRMYCLFAVVDNIVFTNWVGNIKTIEEENERVKEMSKEEIKFLNKKFNERSDISKQGFKSEEVKTCGKKKKKVKRSVT